ncbi:TonB-dependent receptor domain-containing protein [Phenylobacterium deserti]|nr:TonB-dependent receptor [Phenylobacterium deserti]
MGRLDQPNWLLGTSALAGAFLIIAAPQVAAAQAPPPGTGGTAGGATPGAVAGGAAQGSSPGQVEELIVTGTRIPQPNLTSVSPVQVVTAQEVSLGGRTVTADFLNQLPQIQQNAASGLGATSNPLSGPGGVATIDLRGLGQTRTLVLVDGRRLGVGDPNTGNPNPSPDINQIPAQLIERVDVLTGGASATYGSDAIAGVVNFIMRRNFEGFQVDFQESVFQHDQDNDIAQGALQEGGLPIPRDRMDGLSYDFSFVAGRNFADDRGNITGYYTYHRQEPVYQGARDFSACQLNIGDDGQPFCAGSSNSNLFYLSSGLGEDLAVSGNQFVPYGTGTTNPPALFNSNPYNSLIQDNTRTTAGFFANFELNRFFEFYSDFQYMHDKTNVQIAPSGLFQGGGPSPTGGFAVNCNNPFLSAQQQGALGCTPDLVAAGETVDLFIGRRNVEGGPRGSLYRHESYRAVFGSRGDLFGPFRYDLYGSYYKTQLDQTLTGYLGQTRTQNALQAVQGPNGPVCISGGSCVPYNIFQEGGVTQQALDYIILPAATSTGEATQRIVEGTITGDLSQWGIRSPWANDGLGVAGGFQYRKETLSFQPDPQSALGELSGGSGVATPVDGDIKVWEGFAEARLPLIQDRPFIDELQLEVGYRFSSYSIDIETNTYKVGLQWAPSEDIRFRTSYQQAIRAPNILELYTPSSVTNTSQVSEDPCAANATQPAPLEQCLRTGITAAQYGVIPQCPSGQCAVLNGGNLNLREEEAKTFSVGFTTRPRFLTGLTASVDYYRINLEGTISTVPLGVTLQRCLETGSEQFCSQIVRSSAGTLFGSNAASGGYIVGTGVNIGSGVASGVDAQINYSLPFERVGVTGWGALSFTFSGSYLIDAKTTPLPGEDEYNCAGLFGPQCQTVNPRWRHTLRVNWETPWDLLVSAAWRHFGEAKLETDTNEPTIGENTVDPFNHLLPDRNYLDLSAVWSPNEVLSIRAGVNNVLDTDPPIVNALIAGTGLPNTYPSYDLLGRRLFFGFTTRF